MQNDQIYSEIISLVKTKDDFNALNKELDLLDESLYEPKVNFEALLNKSVSDDLGRLILELIKSNSKEVILAEIKRRLSLIKFVNLTLSFDPSQDLINKILNWFSKSVNQNISIDIKVDPKIIAGAIIEFEGKYFDFTLKNKLDNKLKNYV